MIEINLLPEERRPVERTPLPRFLTMLFGVVGICIEVVIFVYFLMKIPNLIEAKERLTRSIDRKDREIKQVKQLEDKMEELLDRRVLVIQLYTRRRLWAPILHRLNEARPEKLWFDSLKLQTKQASRAREKGEANLMLSGYARGKDAASRVYAFVENLRRPAAHFSEHMAGAPRVSEIREEKLKAPPGSGIPEKELENVRSFAVVIPLTTEDSTQGTSRPRR